MFTRFYEWIKNNKKKSIVFALVLILISYNVIKNKNKPNADIQTDTVKKQDLKQTVLATGQVTSTTDLALSFNSAGTVARVNVVVGSKVKNGQVLASLIQGSQAAAYTQAQGALAQAQANYQRVLDGSSSAEVRVAQVTLDNAKQSLENTIKQQATLVQNAYQTLLNTGLTALPGSGNSGSATASISGTYTGSNIGSYQVMIYATGSGLRFQYSGLETGSGIVDISPQPLGTLGLYIQFSTTAVPTNNSWTVSVPNTQASTYVTYNSAYLASLQTQSSAVSAAQNAVASAQAALELKKQQATPAELKVAEAQVLSAQGQLQAAAANLENAIIRAPADGTITSVDVKPGELASASKQVIILQDVDNLHIEANISEANIASVKPDQKVEVSFDALGTDRKFNAKVSAVDPASTLVSGVVNYKVTISLDKLEEIKPGMTANISILTGAKEKVLTVPLRSVINQNGKKYVRVIKDSVKKTYEQKEVTTGMEADGGLVEIQNGLSEGQEVVTFIKTK